MSILPDIAAIMQAGENHVWIYIPVAILLGALHALEPGHAKSIMAAFIVATRGTAAQATLLGVSAAIGHTIIVWILAALGLYLGDTLILDHAKPWLLLASGLLLILLAVRIAWLFSREHTHDHGHGECHGHTHDHGDDVAQRFQGRAVTNADIVWFGLSGGLMPCPSAIAVLLICIQIKAFALGMVMVASFSVGLAITLVAVGLAAAWGTHKASTASGARFAVWSKKLPYISAAFVAFLGVITLVKGFAALGHI